MSPGLLIIEGNAAKLQQQGISKIVDFATGMVAEAVKQRQLRLQHVKINTPKDLESAKTLARWGRFPAVMLVAHGNPSVVELGEQPSLVVPWADAAAMLAPVQPRHLFAVSCFAGGSIVTDVLFKMIPSLTEIVGSPAPLTIAQAKLPMIELLAAAYGGELPEPWGFLLKLGNYAATNGIIVKRTRVGLATSTQGERLMQDLGLIVGRGLLQSLLDETDDGDDPEYRL